MADLVSLALQRKLAAAEASGDKGRTKLYQARLDEREDAAAPKSRKAKTEDKTAPARTTAADKPATDEGKSEAK
jgi:hypothetical protein